MLYPYKKGSSSAKALSQALGIKQIKLEGSSFKGSKKKIVLNWGSSNLSDEVEKCVILNGDKAVKLASNKLSFFKAVKGSVNIPEFTTDKEEAFKWFEGGRGVVVREKLSGHSAEGLVYLEDESEWNMYNHGKAKLYVKYIAKKHEFRVHVVHGKAIDIRRKALRNDLPKSHVNWKVRNYANGFIFAKDGFETPEGVVEEALDAVAATGLDFGAVDVVWNEFYQKAYVLEVNTAPGLEGSTIENYKKAFEKLFDPATLNEERVNRLLEERRKALEAAKKRKPQGLFDVNPYVILDEVMVAPMPQPVKFQDHDEIVEEGGVGVAW